MKPKNLRAEIESLDSDLKIQYVFSRCKTTSNGKAINDAGFSTATFYGWPQEERDYLNSLAMRLKTETGLRATLLLQEAAESAAKVKIDGLKSRNERIKQASATEVLDRIIGKPFQSLITQVNMAADEEDSQEMTRFNLPANAIASSFFDVYRDIQAAAHTEYVFKGGRGSTKSSFASEVLIELLINNPEWHALVARKVGNTLRDSVYSQIVWAIDYLGLTEKFKCITSPLEITYIPTGQKIYFRGGDDPLKIKSIKPRFGYINILWFEELDQFKGGSEVRSIVQSALRGGDKAYVFMSFNPPRSKTNWVNKMLEIPKPNRYVHESDYRTVPVDWLGQAFIDEAEYLKEINPAAYEHEYLGLPTTAGGLVFENVEIRAITDEEIGQFDRIHDGLDFGYYPDPAQWVRCHYDAARMTLYIFDEYRGWKHSNSELYEALVEMGVGPEDTVIADSAEPKSIADLRAYGLSCIGAEKGPESVRYSMKWLQSLVKIVIDNKRCPYAAEEFLNYEHELNKDGEYISAFPDADNHAIDAVRYATNRIWKRRGKK